MGIDGKPDRIKLEMTLMQVFLTLSEGNPGAIRVLTEVIKNVKEIDPQNAFDELGPLLMLDTYRFYGSKIWMLYKDLCGMNVSKTIGMLRAMQLGIIDYRKVHAAIGDDQTPGTESLGDTNVDDLMIKVQEYLPRFKLVPTE